jgi:response regulator RpfG family c-di-GMP phosphodiesterase
MNHDEESPISGYLESLLASDISEVLMTAEDEELVNGNLALLEKKDKMTYEHSLRVGILGRRVGKFIKYYGFYGGFNRRFKLDEFFFASLLHDAGKLVVEDYLFSCPREFSKEDMEKMKVHPSVSYEILKSTHPFAAGIALRHHRYQKDPYPSELPKEALDFPDYELEDIEYHAKILALIDTYDSISVGKGPSEAMGPDSSKLKEMLFKKFPQFHDLIERLYEERIFGTDELYKTREHNLSLIDLLCD